MEQKKRAKKLTKDELLERLRELAKDGDHEAAHGRADAALIDFINDPEIAEAFDAIEKWYA